MRFEAQTDFFSEATMSQYLKGQRYTVRPQDDVLAVQVKQWLREGKVMVLETEAPAAKLTGEGIATKLSIFERIKSWL